MIGKLDARPIFKLMLSVLGLDEFFLYLVVLWKRLVADCDCVGATDCTRNAQVKCTSLAREDKSSLRE